MADDVEPDVAASLDEIVFSLQVELWLLVETVRGEFQRMLEDVADPE